MGVQIHLGRVSRETFCFTGWDLSELVMHRESEGRMQSLKPWHYVLFAAAAVGLGFIVYRVGFSQTVPLASRIMLVDVVTGDLFEASVGGGKSAVIPERNPDTGTLTLLPVHKDDKGVWKVSSRYLNSLSEKVSPKAVVSGQSGEVRVSASSPKTLTLGK